MVVVSISVASALLVSSTLIVVFTGCSKLEVPVSISVVDNSVLLKYSVICSVVIGASVNVVSVVVSSDEISSINNRFSFITEK